MKTREFLGTIPFFSSVLDSAQLDALAAGAHRVEYDHGSVLIREDDRGESMFALIGGSVAVSVRDSGKDRHVATLHPGQIVGEMSLLTGARRAATVTAVAPVVALEIGKAALQPIINASPALYDEFADVVALRQGELDRLYGAGVMRLLGLPRDEFVFLMKAFFGGTV